MNNLTAKQELSTKELQMLQTEMDKRKKSGATAWILWLFLGGFGGHRYFLGKTGTAIAMTLTLGCLGIWTIVDLFLLSGMIRKTNEKIESKIIEEIHLLRNAGMKDVAAAAE